jgi:predicted  nucleic acid-binding Zn-ribbon protein
MLNRLAKKFDTPTKKVVASVVAVALGVSLLGLAGYQSFATAQTQARSILTQASDAAETALREFNTNASGLEDKITSAQAVFDASQGKTADDVARKALQKEIDTASAQLRDADREARELRAIVAQIETDIERILAWPPSFFDSYVQLTKSIARLSAELRGPQKQLSDLADGVVQAQKSWQAEQDQLAAVAAAQAAEEAARAAAERLSKPKQIPSESTLDPTGGATAPSAPPPPDVPAPIVEGFNIEEYLSEFLPTSDYTVQYVTGLCDGYYICGRTLVGGGGNPVIQLDDNPSVIDIYSTEAGKYVLVHEAAHVRQYLFYGTVALMISESGRFVDYPGAAAVEYMADCATIWRIGYALVGTSYPYTSSCTPEQYAEASRIW